MAYFSNTGFSLTDRIGHRHNFASIFCRLIESIMMLDKNIRIGPDGKDVNQPEGDGGQLAAADQGTHAKTDETNRAALLNDFYKPEIFEGTFAKNIVIIFGALIIPILGPAIWLIIATKNLFKTKTKFYRYESKLILDKEKEYNTGERQNGYKKVKVYADVLVKSTSYERILFIAKGLINLVIGGGLGFVQYDIYKLIMAR